MNREGSGLRFCLREKGEEPLVSDISILYPHPTPTGKVLPQAQRNFNFCSPPPPTPATPLLSVLRKPAPVPCIGTAPFPTHILMHCRPQPSLLVCLCPAATRDMITAQSIWCPSSLAVTCSDGALRWRPESSHQTEDLPNPRLPPPLMDPDVYTHLCSSSKCSTPQDPIWGQLLPADTRSPLTATHKLVLNCLH